MIDAYGRNINYLRLSVTELCNLRCRYCMPEDGICKLGHKEMLTEDEMISAVETAVSLGITKLRITGGEPLVKKNILSICRRASAIEGLRELCITTNGTLLPQMAKDLKESGVDRVNISLDTLNPDRYAWITRCGTLDMALEGLKCAVNAGFDKVKVNAVLIGGFNDDEVEEMAALTLRYPIDVRFIELMPMYESGDFGQASMIRGDTILERLPHLEEQPSKDGVARLYRLPGAMGNVGLISPVSQHFCGACNRIRLTADGKLKPCLHSAEEHSIKGLDKEGMRKQFQKTILGKPPCHKELTAEKRSDAGRNMNAIGG